jgi:hypothetical protein
VKDLGVVDRDQALAARLAITEIIAAHSRGIDRLDVDCLKACYWPDGEVDYGSFKGSAHQFAELVMGALAGQYQLTQHSVSNTLIEFRDSEALAESHVTARHLVLAGDEELIYVGRYLDRLECRDDRWKLAHRQVVMDWSRREAVIDERNEPAFADLAKGAQTEDPLYIFLNKE